MNVLITGANGLLATNTVFLLLEQGYCVKALVRNKKKFIAFEHENLELIEGDITIYSTLEKAVKACDYLIHAAATTSQNLLKLADYYTVNVIGTENVIKCCEEHNIKKLIFIGSASSFGHGSLSSPGNESMKTKYPATESLYALSKLKAQKLINTASKEINVVSVCPTFMIGAYDAKPSSGKIILMAQKKVVFYPPGGKNFVHVKDVANGVVNALEFGKNGEIYIISNENMSYKMFFKLVAKINNKRPMLIKIPTALLLCLGYLGELIRRFGIRTNLSAINAKFLTINSFYSNEKARKELQMTFTPVETAIKDAVDWFKSQNMIKK